MSLPSDRQMLRFLTESLGIEGIYRAPTQKETDDTWEFLKIPVMTIQPLVKLQATYAPGLGLRVRKGMDVKVGNHIAPPGGEYIKQALTKLCERSNTQEHPFLLHLDFEDLHPFLDGNGRTGRALWAWHMNRLGMAPFDMEFLHRFYYQALGHFHQAVDKRCRDTST